MTDHNAPSDARPTQNDKSAIVVEAALEVARPVAACYDQLLRVEELPRFLGGVQHVKRMGSSMTRWIATDEPDGSPWTVEIHDLVEDQRFAWRRVDGPRHETWVHLAAVSQERTMVKLVRKYDASAVPAQGSPQGRALEDLHRFKRLVETRPRLGPERARRVDLRCALVGFAPPPHIVRITFLPVANGWTLVASSPPGAAPAVARWFEAMGPSSIRIGRGIAPKVMSVQFERLPGYCDELVSKMQLRSLVLTPDGTASLFLVGAPEKVARFVAHQQLADPAVRARDVRPAPESLQLTGRQLKVLSLAVALGYYEVPHRLTLRDLGSKLKLSAGTVASTLRAAEGAVISAYIDSVSEEQIDENVPGQEAPATQWPKSTYIGRRGEDDARSTARIAEYLADEEGSVDETA